MQTILGAGGAIGIALAKELIHYTKDIRLVSRNPKKVNDTDILFPANLEDKDQLMKAIEGSEVCYITIGIEYRAKVWKRKWPPFIQNVLDVCEEKQCKLVFFDNVYGLDPEYMPAITETVPLKPCSKKGEVRAELDRLVLEAIERGRIQAIIARAPDFFGPIKNTSLLMFSIYDNLGKNKPAQWFCNADKIHSTGYAPELAKGTAMLGNAPDTWNQIWNLPVSPEKINARQWTALFAKYMDKKNAIQVLPSLGIRLLGLFIPILREMYEMRYQYDRDYFFDSSKFNQHFNYTPISHEEAVRLTVEALR